ncbi:MAG: hypothetical protein ACRDZ7_01260 [Acidimicrobiia bacterium]
MDFYDEVLRQLLVALGAALFLGNLVALIRKQPPADIVREAEEAGRPPPQRAPVGRTVGFIVLGLVIMIWGIASLSAS